MTSSLSSLPPLREVVKRYNLAADKRLGQHFLFDGNLTAKIVRAAAPDARTHIIEIGPGPGGLTRALLASDAAHVTVIEKDARCMDALRELQAVAAGRLTIIEGDALTVDIASIAPAPRRVVANLPYNIATELLCNWLDTLYHKGGETVESFTLMFQKEVAERIVAPPGSKTYGRVSVLVRLLTQARMLFDIPASAFTPPPKVTSTVVHLTPRAQPLVEVDKPTLEKIVQAAFGQRRKMLRSALKSLGVDSETLLAAAAIDPTLRAEQLDVSQFAALAGAFYALHY